MLFNSYTFLFLFLPIVLAVFYLFIKIGQKRWCLSWLCLCSFAFYGYWSLPYLGLLSLSIITNFSLGQQIIRHYAHKRVLLTLGIFFNLGLLGYFKYAGFFLENLSAALGQSIDPLNLILPIAISFYSFQQIAYLVDCTQGKTQKTAFFDYLLFVSFFPQLIAGPIVHHREMTPQFNFAKVTSFLNPLVAQGLFIFTLGLFKKVMIADQFAQLADPVFTPSNLTVGFFDGWIAALAYSLQIYFDFSAYSDMAIGLGLMFGIQLPPNFNSPYKAASIIEFWRRWHMTLSRFLRDYLYIPLGGNKKGQPRQLTNIMIVMLIGGLWHGAGWTFILWGGLHGVYIVINHIWPYRLPKLFSHALTLLAIVIAWVFFRAETIEQALYVLEAMAGLNGFILPSVWMDELAALDLSIVSFAPLMLSPDQLVKSALLIPLGYILCLWLPNCLQISQSKLFFNKESHTFLLAIGCIVLFAISVWHLDDPSAFIYFQF